MRKYYEVRFNNTSRKFENDKDAIKHAKALDALGYCVEVVEVNERLYETITTKVYQSASFNPFQFLDEILSRYGGRRYDR